MLLPLEQRNGVTLAGQVGCGETARGPSSDHRDVAGFGNRAHAGASSHQIPDRSQCLEIFEKDLVGRYRHSERLFDERDQLENGQRIDQALADDVGIGATAIAPPGRSPLARRNVRACRRFADRYSSCRLKISVSGG
jgi:hypothetical protein